MDWILAAIASAIGFAGVGILDKIVIEKHSPSPRTFMIFAGALQLPGSLIPMAFVGFESYSTINILIAGGSGVLIGVSLLLMFLALRHQDASVVASVYQTAPVFVAIIAVIFLKESLTVLQWIAILLTVAGAVLISLKRTGVGFGSLGVWFFVMIGASVFFGAGLSLTKAALNEMSFWNVFAYRGIGTAIPSMLLPITRDTIKESLLFVKNIKGLSIVIFSEAILAFAALWFTTIAIDNSPVALATAIMSTRPLFAVIFGAVLSLSYIRVLDEPLDRDSITQRSFAVVMIIVGVSGISLL